MIGRRTWMRAAASVLLVPACRREGPSVAPTAADGSVALGDDGISFADHVAGKVAVVDFWATWCEPCRVSIPKVVAFASAHADIVTVGVHVGHGYTEALAFAREAGMGYPLFADPDFKLSGTLGADKVPTIVVLGRDGAVVHRTSEIDDGVERAVRAALGV